MQRKRILALLSVLLVITILSVFPSIKEVKAATITVPDDYPTIQEAINNANFGDIIFVRNGTYYENVVVNNTVYLVGESMESTIIDGSYSGNVVSIEVSSARLTGFTLQNGESGVFAGSTTASWLVIENNTMRYCSNGIYLYRSQYNVLKGNLMTENNVGFRMDESYYNTFRRNNISANTIYNFYFDLWGSFRDRDFEQDVDASNVVDGKPIYWYRHVTNRQVPEDAGLVVLLSSSSITMEDLELARNNFGIVSYYSDNLTINNVTTFDCETGIADHWDWLTTIRNNTIRNNVNGLMIEGSSASTAVENIIADNQYGIITWDAYYNHIYHNCITNNVRQVLVEYPHYAINTWDGGYPSGGNYWGDYAGSDLFSGPVQDEAGSDGIGDTPYVIDENNTDRYPLVNPYPCIHDTAAVDVKPSKTAVGQGFTAKIELTVANQGHFAETVNVTIYANDTAIGSLTDVILTSGNVTKIAFLWNTTDFDLGDYVIKGVIEPIPDEAYLANDNCTYGIVYVGVQGDVDGSHWVNMLDLYMIAVNFGKSAPYATPQIANCDIDDSGMINMLDLYTAAINFGEKDP
jgi:parallel beta-helix repeat protein